MLSTMSSNIYVLTLHLCVPINTRELSFFWKVFAALESIRPHRNIRWRCSFLKIRKLLLFLRFTFTVILASLVEFSSQLWLFLLTSVLLFNWVIPQNLPYSILCGLSILLGLFNLTGLFHLTGTDLLNRTFAHNWANSISQDLFN